MAHSECLLNKLHNNTQIQRQVWSGQRWLLQLCTVISSCRNLCEVDTGIFTYNSLAKLSHILQQEMCILSALILGNIMHTQQEIEMTYE